jgi:hypothetical protein
VSGRVYILRVGEPAEVRVVWWPRREGGGPGYHWLRTFVEPLLGHEPLEHVSVLWDNRQADMFVSELGRVHMTTRPPLPRNEAATIIYRTAWLRREAETAPERLPWIAGTAVLFERRVWF